MLPFALRDPFCFARIQVVLFTFVMVMVTFGSTFSSRFLCSFFSMCTVTLFRLVGGIPWDWNIVEVFLIKDVVVFLGYFFRFFSYIVL